MEEKQFRMDFDAFLRSFKQSKNGSFAFLLGAGASITSGVQSAEDCIWDWKKLIYVTNNPTNEAFLTKRTTLTDATLYLAGTRKVTEVGISLLSATMTVEEREDNVVIIDHRFCF